MKKFFVLASTILALTATSVAADSSRIHRVIKNAAGEVIFKCGDINRHRQVGLVQPGTVLITVSPVISATGDNRDLNKQQQGFANACNNQRILFANSHNPVVGIGIGVGLNHVTGGGDSNIYGSQAYSGSQSGATAGATSGSR